MKCLKFTIHKIIYTDKPLFASGYKNSTQNFIHQCLSTSSRKNFLYIRCTEIKITIIIIQNKKTTANNNYKNHYQNLERRQIFNTKKKLQKKLFKRKEKFIRTRK